MTGPTRQKRKSRSRGLRATTGCLICKRRHVKCDEAQPQCGPCVKGNRPCVYVSRESSTGPHPEYGEAIHSPANVHAPLQVLVDACQQEQDLDRSNAVSSTASPSVAPTLGSPAYLPHSEPPHGSVLSPGTEVSVTPSRGAPLSWFELLARDAANADTGFCYRLHIGYHGHPRVDKPRIRNTAKI
ncbi:Zn(II)2Cys6 transcription factor [Penicillium brevicompactum]|uniref:Zn(II)2Cys6 transcription factor n=1 Tax=Penicillium brevicompactum TaxID=5074 RepID=UPI0025405226|nr:Zn(II)2Cys6 transcription factor [Penicillium brevicompactum]KAJ5332029.1 Zn(II)2Cys6 transcription factor [Penicillium brevicompactum]